LGFSSRCSIAFFVLGTSLSAIAWVGCSTRVQTTEMAVRPLAFFYSCVVDGIGTGEAASLA
jgi:hypothetical protein